jgi:Tfp pilus assembly protein PilF
MRYTILLAVLGLTGCSLTWREMRAEALALAAWKEQASGHLEAAEQGYRASLDVAASSVAANNLGVLWAQRGDLAQAQRWLVRATASDEKDTIARINLGVVLYRLGRRELARAELATARRIRYEVSEQLPPQGRVNWDRDRYLAATAAADAMAVRYLLRMQAAAPLSENPAALAESLMLERAAESAWW